MTEQDQKKLFFELYKAALTGITIADKDSTNKWVAEQAFDLARCAFVDYLDAGEITVDQIYTRT